MPFTIPLVPAPAGSPIPMSQSLWWERHRGYQNHEAVSATFDPFSAWSGSKVTGSFAGLDARFQGLAEDMLVTYTGTGGYGVDFEAASYGMARALGAQLLDGAIATAAGGNTLMTGWAADKTGAAGRDFIFGGREDNVFSGGEGDDFINGREGNNILFGDGGNDLLKTYSGRDALYGGAGDDMIDSGEGDDLLDGGDGNDAMTGRPGDDIILGGRGDDFLQGCPGRDQLFGEEGNDKLTGNDDGDFLNGGAGNDLLIGGTEGDFFIFDGAVGTDVIADLNLAEDRIVVTSDVDPNGIWFSVKDTGELMLNFNPGSSVILVGYSAADAGRVQGAISFGDDLLPANYGTGRIVTGTLGDDVLTGGAGRDVIMASEGRDIVSGGSGHDELYGNQGNDILFGNQGNDILYGGQGNDEASGGQGNDFVYGNLGDDVLDGNKGDDFVHGGQGNDIVRGGDGNDQLFGGLGDDLLFGDAGNDRLTGGAGNDLFSFHVGSGNDVITDFQAGLDRIALNGQSYVLASSDSGAAVLALSGGGSIELAGIGWQGWDADWLI